MAQASPDDDPVTLGGSLKLEQPVPLPEVLDVLVVGGGPAGTATAFRAKELGLSALVIDYDDLMKRIRDYSKEKLILPNFGGGDTVPFPEGGELVQRLRFDAVDKDEMVTAWKEHYRALNVPARIGLELIGLGERIGGVWTVQCFSLRKREPVQYRAQNVVLAVGRGVPRKFDIPGDTQGIPLRLDDAAKYVGRPVCVIGGGTSAAEAVIAISGAKVQAEDPSPVYWSYRGEQMPKVSESLSRAFFEAFVINGNVIYLRRSEPVAVVRGYDHKEYLSIRIDRKELPGRPNETLHLEFPKESVVACIGEDVPEALLRSMGIEPRAGADGKKRMLVTAELETQRPGLFLVGDLLAPFHWETISFDSPPEAWEKVKHQGNIKSAIIDGVRVAEVIASRIHGEASLTSSPEASVSRPAPPPPPQSESAPVPRVAALVHLDPSGVESMVLLGPFPVTIGRANCVINLSEDSLVSKLHAAVSFNVQTGTYELHDEGSENGTYLYLRGKEQGRIPVSVGQLILAGRQRLLVAKSGDGAPVLIHHDASGARVAEHALTEEETTFGSRAKVSLGADDATLSRSHFTLLRRGETLEIYDHSRNGTLVSIPATQSLVEGDRFVVGHAQFVLRWIEAEAPQRAAPLVATPEPRAATPPTAPAPGSSASGVAAARPPGAASAPRAPAPARPATPAQERQPVQAHPVAQPAGKRETGAASGSPRVIFEGVGEFPIRPGQSLLDVARANGVPIEFDCKEGTCGMDPLEVLEGTEFLQPVGDKEEGGLDCAGDLLPPGAVCRMACCVKDIKGAVRVRVLKKRG